MRCDWLVPWWDAGLGVSDWTFGDGDAPQCNLTQDHDGPHRIVNDRGVHIMLQSMVCDDCDEPYDYCGCFEFWAVATPANQQ